MDNRLMLSVAEDEADDLRLDELARQLRDVLLQTDLDAIEPLAAVEVPPLAKPGAASVAGALVATVGALPLQQLVDIVLHWLTSARSRRSVRLKIGDDEIVVKGGITDEIQQQLITEWLNRHPVDAARAP